MDTTRTITGKSTIPLGTAGTGTVTALAADNTILQVNGGDIDDFEKFQNGYRNIWIYAVTENKLAKVKGIQTNGAAIMVYTDRSMAFVFNNAFTIIVADLIEWGAQNTGAASGTVDGATLPAGSADNRTVIHNPGNGIPLERYPVLIDGTGTSIKVYEVKHAIS